jgi:hypothetical protein
MLFWVARVVLRVLYNHFAGAVILQLFRRVLAPQLWGWLVWGPVGSFLQLLFEDDEGYWDKELARRVACHKQ